MAKRNTGIATHASTVMLPSLSERRNDDILFEYEYIELRDLLLHFLGYAWREVFSKRGLLLQN